MQFMKLPDVMQITKLSRSSIYAMMKNETFPQHFKIGKRGVAWTEESILNWMNSTIIGN
jgi:prophage regulatory protein